MRILQHLDDHPGFRPATGRAPGDLHPGQLRAAVRQVQALNLAGELAQQARRRKPGLLQRLVLSADELRQHQALLDAITDAEPLIQRLQQVTRAPLVEVLGREPDRSLIFGLVGVRERR